MLLKQYILNKNKKPNMCTIFLSFIGENLLTVLIFMSQWGKVYIILESLNLSSQN